ncbi:hypothetical protein PhiCh1p06 [Natrialba phage PhiCh1]|uniref:Virus protein phiCh1-VP5 n=2 Tax=root TaxID=1 RepID=D3T2F5_NATMM|nr:hypothetical protein [Natrialba magadii]NP_665923.1 hypothetical protein PhiCh1p06 [Natrialba phage PhiCh1]YP_010078037.1 uncharacterized protein KMC42_gp07 [Natrialba phage PhiCh1]AAM88680.1 unknown [Natrialba phage PhiCh1]ADD07764.1 virus protein phiCh1-VP5 [Natrialba magadii ATCC 43099]ELY23011.1 hypothetical protein C500_21145 [Natrialba magadii ATCC 43099]QBJ01188.1 uncharacterized protein PhiCh1_030 [Natrialba phage PhiCh1]
MTQHDHIRADRLRVDYRDSVPDVANTAMIATLEELVDGPLVDVRSGGLLIHEYGAGIDTQLTIYTPPTVDVVDGEDVNEAVAKLTTGGDSAR